MVMNFDIIGFCVNVPHRNIGAALRCDSGNSRSIMTARAIVDCIERHGLCFGALCCMKFARFWRSTAGGQRNSVFSMALCAYHRDTKLCHQPAKPGHSFPFDLKRELNMHHTQDKNNDNSTVDYATAMQRLIDEHASGLVFAAEIDRIAKEGSSEEVAAAMERVSEFLAGELEHHFQHEEQTILGELLRNHPEYAALCIAIGREHGQMRFMLVETSGAGPRRDLANFAYLLKQHTLLENEGLFPVIEKLFSPEQMREIANFSPRRLQQIPNSQRPASNQQDAAGRQKWWAEVVEFSKPGQKNGRVVLLPQYNPELIEEMAQQTGLALFDFQREVMSNYGRNADAIELDVLDESLRRRAEQGGVISHNVEALLCVKSKQERGAWLQAFLDADWPNPILLPISIYQPDVPDNHPAQVLHYEISRSVAESEA
jgi:hemerythrin-like domain-containing protein